MNMKRDISILIAVIIMLVVGTTLYMGVRRPSTGTLPDNEIACTMDALICPDGSAVGRTGPQCAFVACPDQDSFSGKLVQIEGKFYLETSAPSGLPEGASMYRIPLQFKMVTNVLGQLINQNVRVRGTFSEGNTLEVTELTEAAVQAGDSAEIGIRETKTIQGLSITLNKIVGDYRCPIDAVCIEAGAITANVTFKAGAQSKTFNMASDEVPQTFAGYSISITGTKPSRIAAEEPNPQSYRVTFRVTK